MPFSGIPAGCWTPSPPQGGQAMTPDTGRPADAWPASAQPPETRPPGVQPPETRPPGVQPPETRPPGVQPPDVRPPLAGPPAGPPAAELIAAGFELENADAPLLH